MTMCLLPQHKGSLSKQEEVSQKSQFLPRTLQLSKKYDPGLAFQSIFFRGVLSQYCVTINCRPCGSGCRETPHLYLVICPSFQGSSPGEMYTHMRTRELIFLLPLIPHPVVMFAAFVYACVLPIRKDIFALHAGLVYVTVRGLTVGSFIRTIFASYQESDSKLEENGHPFGWKAGTLLHFGSE